MSEHRLSLATIIYRCGNIYIYGTNIIYHMICGHRLAYLFMGYNIY